jgi:hypothetical protein
MHDPDFAELRDLLADPRLTRDDVALIHATLHTICDTTLAVLDRRPDPNADVASGVRRLIALERERIPLGLG